jgi:transcriptional regulator with XRE-family HTH domain
VATLRDLGEFIREQRRNAQISLRQLAQQAGVSNPYLSQIERGLRKPSAEVLQQIANALRVSTPIMYLRAGLLEQREGQGVLAAIAADEALTARQKQTLTEIYEAFRRENVRTGREPAPDADPGVPEPAAEPEPPRDQPATRRVRKVAKRAVKRAAAKVTTAKATGGPAGAPAAAAPAGDRPEATGDSAGGTAAAAQRPDE